MVYDVLIYGRNFRKLANVDREAKILYILEVSDRKLKLLCILHKPTRERTELKPMKNLQP